MSAVNGRTGVRYRVDDAPLDETGGQSVLYLCDDPAGRRRVYKRYKLPLADRAEVAQLGRLATTGREVVRRAEGPDGKGELARTPESSVNWPIDLVDGPGGTLAGVVLPLIPDSFMRDDRKGSRRPRTLDFHKAWVADPPTARTRVGVLVRVCDVFDYLDQQQLVHGDVSWKNIVWRGDDPHAYLIDCDGLRPRSPLPASAPSTPEWRDPRLVVRTVPSHDHFSDRYALALVLYRVLFLNPGGPRWRVPGREWITAANYPDRLAPRLRDLFSRAFDDPAATTGRPTAAAWRAALLDTFMPGGSAYRADALWVLDEYANTHHRTTFTPPGQGPAGPGTATTRITPAQQITQIIPITTAAPLPQTTKTTTAAQAAPFPQAARPPTRRTTGGAAGRTAPPPTRSPVRRTPPPATRRWARGLGWTAAALALIGLLGAGAYLWHRQETAAPAAVTPPAAGAPAAPAPCPAAADAGLPADQRSHAVLVHHYTTALHDITLCRTAYGNVYYHGVWRDPAKKGAVTLPATALPGGGWEAANGPYRYIVERGWVTVAHTGRPTKRYRITGSR
ncbi:hypothetical protein [Actinacidiphila sp. ITFR-21]|uniref:hypothetical protein n=1 Tax=Actinacidiphila sp. ITFR-21 TaxID=3075199 RepID=UPI00288B2131|nr:hypothetical protein [Streptomyces sp. ITFR-21]WNI16102.1 hypothetical protein RLT57_11555 [Streptomyces sp. ITFR-21]